jgi:diguanylate cyclase (GGDEF)-like protein/PAS domain S-box-containing protein
MANFIYKPHAKWTIALAFGLIALIIASFGAVSYGMLSASHARMEAINANHAAKTRALDDMYRAARERGILLVKMVNRAADFDSNAGNLDRIRFSQLGGEFAQARQSLAGLIHQDSLAELAAYREHGLHIQATLDAVKPLLEALDQENYPEANRLLLEQAIPAQDRVVKYLDTLKEAQQRALADVMRQAHRQEHTAITALWLAGVLALLLCIALGNWVAQRLLRAEHEISRHAGSNLCNAVITTDTLCQITYMNGEAEKLTGWQLEEAQNKPVSEVLTLVSQRSGEIIATPLRHCLDHGEVTQISDSLALQGRSGVRFAIDITAAPMRDPRGNVSGAILLFHNLANTASITHQLFWDSRHDSLTGLLNRREFHRKLEEAELSAREQNQTHTLAYIDLDQFKLINDSCGHAAGDEVLRQAAAILRENLAADDVLARLGGDEFAILLPDCPLPAGEARIQTLLLILKNARFHWEDKTFEVNASAGLLEISTLGNAAADLLSAADMACQSAKEQGRSRIMVLQSDTDLLQKRHSEMAWASRITEAIDTSHMQLFQQPIVPIRPDTPGLPQKPYAEILLRMRDRDGKLVPPGAFLPAAERYNLITSVDRWVIRAAFSILCQRPGQRYAINVSGYSLSDDRFLGFIQAQFDEFQPLPENICFEITETAVVANLQCATHLMTTLKAKGCCFALDDFGTGMSSYAYLKTLPVDYLKIDGTFVRHIATDPISRAMVESINTLGHAMGLRTIAEFVEDQAILEHLDQMQVDFAQGYLMAQPTPLADPVVVDYSGLDALRGSKTA